MIKVIQLYPATWPSNKANGVSLITFPTGEAHVRAKIDKGDRVCIEAKSPCADIMKIGMAADIARNAGASSVELYLPFVPFARQDRRAVPEDAFSIKVFANLLNSLGLDKVIIVDPHSEVTPALINNVRIVPQHRVAYEAVDRLTYWLSEDCDPTKNISLVGPDLGSAKKVKELQSYAANWYHDWPVIQADKTRDSKTGKITGFRILDGDASGKNCIIIDDICDGGGTFLGTAAALREGGAKSVSLFTTHGIYSKGTEVFDGVIDHILCSDSLPAPKFMDDKNRIRLYDLMKAL